jgi:hypothetical protein
MAACASASACACVCSVWGVWQVEPEEWTTGGVVPFGSNIRLKHAVTSRYLTCTSVGIGVAYLLLYGLVAPRRVWWGGVLCICACENHV